MATVTSITAAKAEEIEDASVVTGTIDSGTGHLLLTTGGGTVIDAGVARPDAAIAAAVLVETNNRIADVDAEQSARVAADSALSTAIDNLVNDTGTISGLTGFTLAAGWATASARYRVITIGSLDIVDLFFSVQRNGADITTNASGNISNVDIFSACPTAIRPTVSSVGGMGPGAATGRIVAISVADSGVISLSALGGTNDLVDNEVVACHMVYFR